MNNNKLVIGDKTPRESNLELLRIFAMMAIIAHHSVVNSGVVKEFDFLNPTINTYFLMIWGMWGKTAINSFILISGYFLCKSTLTWQRYLKLLAEVYFYSFGIILIFAITSYEPLTISKIFKNFFEPLIWVNNDFIASFLAFYIFVPVYNKLLNILSEKEHRLLIMGLLLYFTIASTFFFAPSMNEPLWYATLYMIAAYIRIYPNKWTESSLIAWITLFSSVLLAICSVAAIMFAVSHAGMLHIPASVVETISEKPQNFLYWFVSDSNKLLALVVGLSAFLVAKNAPKFHNKFINTMAAGTFGVLLIHASSNTMRTWLWQDILNMPSLATASLWQVLIITLSTPIVIFMVCSAIDYLRRIWIERPLMSIINK
ncbi:acyltransferase family protein [Bacteroides bouchesdurhonensis]|uniref:acyltransferase family protein n=1 Tax=Bacteroides bouchesdurhonensis TaxID=1841855 RepID=UPI0011DD30DC|nr:acyltransferase family protein [Bacteroides bouchesdurhonensis]